MRQYFSKDIDLYGGRKGFTDLMLSRGNTIENISIWMGHSTLDRTWRSYKQKQNFTFRVYYRILFVEFYQKAGRMYPKVYFLLRF